MDSLSLVGAGGQREPRKCPLKERLQGDGAGKGQTQFRTRPE